MAAAAAGALRRPQTIRLRPPPSPHIKAATVQERAMDASLRATRPIATVFGGTGFIGRHVVRRLADAGHAVRVAVRDTEAALALKPLGVPGQVVPLHAPLGEAALVARAVAGAGQVVNLVGILAQRRAGDFDRVHHRGAAAIAAAAAAAGVQRLVHVSALGAAADSPSQYARSKAAGEAAVRAAFPGAVILRPSVVFGPADQFFNRFARLAQLLPAMPVFEGGTRFQPVHVGDVADAVIAGLTRADAPGRTFELGGPKVWTMREILAWILAQTGRSRPLIDVPRAIAELQARVLERLPGQLLTRDQLVLLRRHNVVAPGAAGLAALGITPLAIEQTVPGYLARYRSGPVGARE
jgi:NADH dehydrogenase